MQNNEHLHACFSGTEPVLPDAVTDSMLKNILVMGNSVPETEIASKSTYEKQLIVQEEDLTVDEFADFQSYTKSCGTTSAFTNGRSTVFDDFDYFVTATKSISGNPFPPRATIDRYDVFRELDSHSNDQNAFVHEPPAESEDRIWIWKKCLVSCKQLLQKSFNALIVSHGEETAVEALRTEPGAAFIQDLHQLYLMTQRIGQAQQSLCLTSGELSDLLTDVAMTWRPLHSLFNKVTHFTETPANNSPPSQSANCYICLCREPSELVLVNAIPYHISCANLWIHCIRKQLPSPK